MMKLEDLVEACRAVEMTEKDREAQRRSFAYGNTKTENDLLLDAARELTEI